jgi:hypothetical protein
LIDGGGLGPQKRIEEKRSALVLAGLDGELDGEPRRVLARRQRVSKRRRFGEGAGIDTVVFDPFHRDVS